MTIEVRQLRKNFGSFAALDGVDLKVADGELLALLGPSGSGKTTLLRIIAGLDWPDAGEVNFDGENALIRGAGERQVGFVFQHYALFRHMSVFENIAFGLRVQPRRVRKSEAAIRARVKELLDLVQLDWLADTSPRGLAQSHGLMVNYLYDLDHIKQNHEAYAANRTIVASNAVRRLARHAPLHLMPAAAG